MASTVAMRRSGQEFRPSKDRALRMLNDATRSAVAPGPAAPSRPSTAFTLPASHLDRYPRVMCVSCMSSVDAMVWNSVAIVGVGASGVRRLRDAAAGRRPLDRRQKAYDRNSEFLRSLGLDPAEVLGPAPG